MSKKEMFLFIKTEGAAFSFETSKCTFGHEY